MDRILAAFIAAMTIVALHDDANAQLTIAKYPKQIACEINFVEDLPGPVVTTACTGEVHVTRNQALASGGCAGTLIISFTYADDCGNVAEAEQYVTLKDTEEPQLVGVPADQHLLQTDVVHAPEDVRSWDNSNKEFPVVLTEETKDNVLIRTWTCTDDCGNTAKASQRIFLPK